MRLPIVAVIATTMIATGSCQSEEDSTAGPLEILSAYVLDRDPASPTMSGSCDLTDPRSWGGNFKVADNRGNPLYLRCVPDLLNPLDEWMTFSYDVQLRVVFSEPLSDDAITDQTRALRSGLVTATTPAGTAVPVDVRPNDGTAVTSYYDPSGRDFKQSGSGTAPPGPAIVIRPGDGSNVVGLPSSTTTQLCLSADSIVDAAGRHLIDSSPLHPRCMSITTRPFGLAGFAPPLGQPIPADTLAAMGLQIRFNAPVPNAVLSDATNVEVRVGSMNVSSACLAVRPDTSTSITPGTSTAVILTVSNTGSCSLGSNMVSATLTVKDTIHDQYGAQFGGATLFLTIAPAGSISPDAGADAL